MNAFSYWLKRSSPTILTWISAFGTIATGTAAAVGTPRAIERLQIAKSEKGSELTLPEKIIAAAPSYIPAVGCAAATLICTFGSNALNKRQQASLISAYAILSGIHKEYTDKVKSLCGEDVDKQIRKEITEENSASDSPPWNEKMTFYEAHRGSFFERTMQEVMSAEYHFNRNFTLRGYANLNEFYEFLDLDKTEDGEKLGWSLEAGEVYYGYSWVDFEHRSHVMDNGMIYCEIYMPFSPTADYLGVFDEYDT